MKLMIKKMCDFSSPTIAHKNPNWKINESGGLFFLF